METDALADTLASVQQHLMQNDTLIRLARELGTIRAESTGKYVLILLPISWLPVRDRELLAIEPVRRNDMLLGEPAAFAAIAEPMVVACG